MITQLDLFPPQPATARGASTFISYDSVNDRIAYAAGKSVIVRSLGESKLSPVQFTKHTVTTTAAAFSPSGNYVASGDEAGNVIVWDTSVHGKENTFEQPTIKSEFQILSGAIKSIAWDADNSRIIAVGSGKEKFGHCFTWDSGNSIGEIQGHSETINAVDIKPQRPYRAATVGDDKSMVFFTGPPFKFDKSSRNHHTNAARAVKFSPDGKWLVSVGADRMIVLYDGKTGEYIKKVEKAHEGGISSVSWFPDSTAFVTASADNTLKKWNSELLELQQYVVSQKVSVEAQQVGVVVTKNYIMSLSLNGDLNQFAHDDTELQNIIRGHQRAITTIAVHDGQLISGGSDGTLFSRAVKLPILDTTNQPFCESDAHSNYVTAIKTFGSDVVTSGWDDKLKLWSEGKLVGSADLGGQPKGIAIALKIVVLLEDAIKVFDKSLSLVAEEKLQFVASSIDCVQGQDIVYVTNETAKQVEVYSVSTGVSHDSSYPALRAAPTLVRVSPDGEYLAVAENTGKYTLYKTSDKSAVTTRWAFHSSRVNDAQWTSDSKYLVSGGLDCAIYIYLVARPSKVLKSQLTHQTGVTALAWLDYGSGPGAFASAGLDGVIKTWAADFSAY